MDSRLRGNDKAWISAVYPREGGGGNDKKMKIELGQFIFIMAVFSCPTIFGGMDYTWIVSVKPKCPLIDTKSSAAVKRNATRDRKPRQYWSGFV